MGTSGLWSIAVNVKEGQNLPHKKHGGVDSFVKWCVCVCVCVLCVCVCVFLPSIYISFYLCMVYFYLSHIHTA